jgi:hypothetical protein
MNTDQDDDPGTVKRRRWIWISLLPGVFTAAAFILVSFIPSAYFFWMMLALLSPFYFALASAIGAGWMLSPQDSRTWDGVGWFFLFLVLNFAIGWGLGYAGCTALSAKRWSFPANAFISTVLWPHAS